MINKLLDNVKGLVGIINYAVSWTANELKEQTKHGFYHLTNKPHERV